MRGQFGETEVEVRTAELLKKIIANRDTHRAEFEKAWEGYKKVVTAWFEKRLEDLKAGHDFYTVMYRDPIPQDHTDDYNRIIAMLEMETREVIKISEAQFANYVLDDWAWSQAFTTSNAVYAARS